MVTEVNFFSRIRDSIIDRRLYGFWFIITGAIYLAIGFFFNVLFYYRGDGIKTILYLMLYSCLFLRAHAVSSLGGVRRGL